jgi:hypothetical protein
MFMKEEWIGIDLDGTLAEYNGWQGSDHIGKPIEKMVEFVKKLIAEGNKVKIFTARAYLSEQIPPVKEWLLNVGLGDLEVTNVKDLAMIMLYDDRCQQVVPNTGNIVKNYYLPHNELPLHISNPFEWMKGWINAYHRENGGASGDEMIKWMNKQPMTCG